MLWVVLWGPVEKVLVGNYMYPTQKQQRDTKTLGYNSWQSIQSMIPPQTICLIWFDGRIGQLGGREQDELSPYYAPSSSANCHRHQKLTAPHTP